VIYKRDPSKPNQIFVFGSNMAGRHGAGAALDAVKNWGARYGQAYGRQGRAFAIPTKGKDLETLDLKQIQGYINAFIDYADEREDLEFLVTRVGCGLAGYNDDQIGPMFRDAPHNCVVPTEWEKYLANR
jgi:hypothetical protein